MKIIDLVSSCSYKTFCDLFHVVKDLLLVFSLSIRVLKKHPPKQFFDSTGKHACTKKHTWGVFPRSEIKGKVLWGIGGRENSATESKRWLQSEGGLAWGQNVKQRSFTKNHYTRSHGDLVEAERWRRGQTWRDEAREAGVAYSQTQLCRDKMWNNQGSVYSRVNISKTNHPWYAYQIPFADIVLCNTALWVEYHKDYMGSSCSPSYFAPHLSSFHSLSVLWSPNIIQHNGISTKSLYVL